MFLERSWSRQIPFQKRGQYQSFQLQYKFCGLFYARAEQPTTSLLAGLLSAVHASRRLHPLRFVHRIPFVQPETDKTEHCIDHIHQMFMYHAEMTLIPTEGTDLTPHSTVLRGTIPITLSNTQMAWLAPL